MEPDKRNFCRYSSKSGLTISHGGQRLNAETLDYSLDGMCVELKGEPDIRTGEVVEVDIQHPRIRSQGKVIWTARTGVGLRLGIHRLGLLYGSMHDFNVSDILLGLHRSRKTGVLNVIEGDAHRSVYFDGGDMIFASSSLVSERFGEMLVEKGIISRKQYDDTAAASLRKGSRIGAELVVSGYIGAEVLVREVRNHVEGIILRLFETGEGDFVFKESPLDIKEKVTLKLSAANIIYRGIKGIRDEERIRKMCPSDDAVLSLSQDPLDLFQDVDAEKSDRKVFSLVDGKRSVRQIIGESPVGRAETVAALCAFMNARMLEIKEGSEEQEEYEHFKVFQERAGQKASQEFVNQIEHLYSNHEELGYYGVLEVSETASSEDIKKAYYKKAKQFHPDRHYSLTEDMKEKLNVVFSYITSAYSTLVSSDLRRAYDAKPEPAHQEADPVEMAREKFARGREALRQARLSEAVNLFSEAAYLQNSEPQYHFFCGLALSRSKKYKEAERAMQRALRLDPFNPDILAEAGHVFIALGFPLRAKGNFSKALKIRPNHKRALEGMEKF